MGCILCEYLMFIIGLLNLGNEHNTCKMLKLYSKFYKLLKKSIFYDLACLNI
jgi:hypothetical protein